ncbi:MAG TPA: MarR family transcriptional regulator [Candidatus Eremiobacteraceae bacterium]|nr:MarR family transcriptional regulator [Candidatus Eremiobacteraceae bacterium]
MKRNELMLDHESRARRDDHQALRLWLRILSCSNVIEQQVRRGLRREFHTTLPRFDFMAQLDRNPSGLKMGEISEMMMVTSGNVTGIADELEAAGLVARHAVRGDRRAFTVKLTKAGRRKFAEMARAHERWIVSLFAGLSKREQSQLFEPLAKLKRHAASRNGEIAG